MAETGAAARQTLTGSVLSVVFHNPENGYCVLRAKLNDRKDPAYVIGCAPVVQEGQKFMAEGAFVYNERYRRQQFESETLQLFLPDSKEALIRYLSSGAIEGIGKETAKRIVNYFGDQTLQTLDQSPAALERITGIGIAKRKIIEKAWERHRQTDAVSRMLLNFGVGAERAARIVRHYGAEASAVVQRNPYRLAEDIVGIGFTTADTIGRNAGIPDISPLRVAGGLRHVMTSHAQRGHVGYPVEDLVREAQALLNVDIELVRQGFNESLKRNDFSAETHEGRNIAYLNDLLTAEKECVQHLLRLMRARTAWSPIEAGRAIAWAESKLHVTLSASQREAIAHALAHKVSVLTGGPGTGKSTLTRAYLEILSRIKAQPLLCAPTGRAARRLAEVTGTPASTIHRLLHYDPRLHQFLHNENNPVPANLVIIDETSMVDVRIFRTLLRAIPTQAKVLIIGDSDQLPSIGPGRVLSDLIAGGIPTARLSRNEVFRQARDSHILLAADQVNQGIAPDWRRFQGQGDFTIVPEKDPELIRLKMLETILHDLPQVGFDPLRDIQVLSPLNRGTLGNNALNELLQGQLNPRTGKRLKRYGKEFFEGDRVLQTVNNYDLDVCNGDLGIINTIDTSESVLTVDFNGQLVEYAFDETDELMLSYSCSVHRSQGAEYPAVVMPLTTAHYVLLTRPLLYTAITRGKKNVTLVGDPSALSLAVRNQAAGRERVTTLAARLKAALA